MSYASIGSHAAMVFDATRNERYAQAIRQFVTPQSIVLDLGAGLGLHGLLAAHAGAARTYLVEPQSVLQVAREVAAANGLTDRVVLLQDRIEDVALPERVDLIISVFTGNLLFSEDLLPSLFHARDRCLKPGGRLLPDRAQLWLAPVCAPLLHARHVARWSESVLGLDFSAARRLAANEVLWLNREDLKGSTRLGPGAVVAEMDLATASSADCHAAAECEVTSPGLCHGLLGWIRIKAGDEWISTEPEAPAVHWSSAMLPLDPPLPLQKGEHVKLMLVRPQQGDWTWTVEARGGSRRHSTFLSRAEGARELGRLAPGSRPGLSGAGKRVARILGLLGQGLTNQAVADVLGREDGLGPAQALREVQSIANQYGHRR